MMSRRHSVHRSLVVLAATISLLANPIPWAWSLDGTVDAIQYNAKRQALQVNSSAPLEASLNTVSVNGHKRIILDIENAEIGKSFPNDAALLKNLSAQFPAIQTASVNQFGGSRPVVRILLDLQGDGYDVQLAKANGVQLELKINPLVAPGSVKALAAVPGSPGAVSSSPQPKHTQEEYLQKEHTIQEQQKIIAKLQEKLTEVVNRPASVSSPNLMTEEMKKTLVAMSQKYNDLLKENQKLRQQLEAPDATGMKTIELKKLRDTNQVLQAEVVKLSQENNRLKQQPGTKSSDAEPDTVNEPLALAKKELVNAIDVINRQNKEINDLKEHIEAVKLQVGASARDQITLLNNRLEEKEAQLKAIQKSGQMIPAGKAVAPAVDVERLLTQLKQKDTQIIALTKQLNAIDAKSEEEATAGKALLEKQKQLDALSEDVKTLQQKLSDRQQLEGQLKDRDDKIKTLTEQLKQTFKTKNEADNANEITYNDLKKTLVVLNKKYDELKTENAQLRATPPSSEKDEQILALTKQMEQLRHQLEAEKANTTKINQDVIRYEDLKKTLTLMNQKNETLKAENETLRQANEAPSKGDSEALQKLKNQLKSMQQEQEKAQNTKNSEMQVVLKERSQLLQELDSRQNQLKALQEELILQSNALQASRDEVQVATQKLQAALNTPKEAPRKELPPINLSNDALKALEKKLADLGRVHEETLKEDAKLREQLQGLQVQKPDPAQSVALLALQKELSEEKAKSAQTISTLQQQLREGSEKAHVVAPELAQLRENLDTVKKTLKTSEDSKVQLAQQLQDANKQLKQFQEKQETLTVAASATADLLKEKQNLLKKLQEQQNQLSALSGFKEENKKLTTRLDVQTQKMTELEAQLEKTKNPTVSQKPQDIDQSPQYQALSQQKEALATELSGMRGQLRDLQEQLAKERKKEPKGKPTFNKETAVTPPVNGEIREAENYFLDGKKADQEGDLTAAVEGYQKAYAIAPENPKYIFALTTTLMALKNYQEAIRLLQQYLTKDPQNRDAYNQLGKAYLLSGKSDEAQNAFSKAVHISALSNYATTLKKLGKLAEAERVLKVALALSPKDSDILFNLGNLYNSSNNLPAAQNAYEQAIQSKPDFAEAHYNLGLVYSKTGDKPNAISHLEKYLDLSPEASNRTVVENYVKKLKGS